LKSSIIKIDKYADLSSQYLAAVKSMHQLKEYMTERNQLKDNMRRLWPDTKTTFTATDDGPGGEVRITQRTQGFLKTRQVFNELVWVQLTAAAKRRLLQANIVYREEAKTSGPRAVIKRKHRTNLRNTISIQAVRGPTKLPIRTTYY